MVLLYNILVDCKYDKLTILNKVYNMDGVEEDYGYANAYHDEYGWRIDNDFGLTGDYEVCGFYYGERKGEPLLVIYTPSNWVRFDENLNETARQKINDGYEAFNVRNKIEKE